TYPHVGHRLLLRGYGDAGGAPFKDRAHAGAAQDLLRKLRRRSHRVRLEAGALSHQAPAHHRLPRRFPRTDDGRALADGLEAAAETALLADGAWGYARALSRCLSGLRGRSAGCR